MTTQDQVRSVNPVESPFTGAQPPTTTRTTPHPRWLLGIEASIWRFLGKIGFYFHTFASPSPKPPSFTRQFPTTNVASGEAAILELSFYVPEDYALRTEEGKRYPVVVNLHGGGFTMGTSKDDGRWAAAVLEATGAIFVSVGYRLAPQFPFPTAVEDGVEALLHLAANSESFGIDPKKMALSGFSAGGNMAFTIPLRLQTHLQSIKNEIQSKSVSGSLPTAPLPQVVSIVAWYPNVDNRLTREERRAACVRPDKTLPPILTNLFDESYMPELDSKLSPYASPAAASDEELITALPEDIALYLCEWDMLLQEGELFAQRLKELGKKVHCVTIKERRHAFDKSPYPFSVDPEVKLHYAEACGLLKDAFE
jgi:acetyl esterase/lipase